MIKKIIATIGIVAMLSGTAMAAPRGGDSNASSTAIAGASANANANANANSSSSAWNINTNKNTNTNINITDITNKNNLSNSQGQLQGQSQSTDNANNSSQSTTLTVEGSTYEAKRIPVSTAVGGMVGATGGGQYQCLVPVSVGGSTALVGLSYGSASRDKDCVIFQLVAQSSDPAVKTGLHCLIPEYQEMMKNIGRSCPSADAIEVSSREEAPTGVRVVRDTNGNIIARSIIQ